MKKVLIVSPRFPPVSAPDHQRVRMMLPSLEQQGWSATILAVDPRFVEAPVEPNLAASIPPETRVASISAIPQWLTRRLGFGSLALRCYGSLRRAGLRLLRRESFDLVFFSTTEFGVLPLALRWKRLCGAKYVIDLQDPWVSDYYTSTRQRPPGGHLKHSVTQAFARRNEGAVVRQASHIVSVSPAYVETLLKRYPDLPRSKFTVIPFGGSRRDFEIVSRLQVRQSVFNPDDGKAHWMYAGTAPPGIRHALTSFLLALKRAFGAGVLSEDAIRIHFVGTDYAAAHAATERVMPIVRELSMERVVAESPARLPYFETLKCLLDASALLVLGWDEAGYTASKLYPNILAGKPLLAVFHERSSVNDVMRATHAGTLVTFATGAPVQDSADAIFERWFASGAFRETPRTDWDAFEQFTNESMTRRVVRVFDSVSGYA